MRETVVAGAEVSHSSILSNRLSDENNVSKLPLKTRIFVGTIIIKKNPDVAKILLSEFKLSPYSYVSVYPIYRNCLKCINGCQITYDYM